MNTHYRFRMSETLVELTAEEMSQIDQEALELLQLKKALIEQKRLEKIQEEEDLARVTELCERYKAFAWKVQFEEKKGPISPKEKLEMWKTVANYMSTYTDVILDKIRDFKKNLWENATEEIINRNNAAQASGACGWTFPNIKFILGTDSITLDNPEYWKAIVAHEVGEQKIRDEYKSYIFYCEKYTELHRDLISREQFCKDIQKLKDENLKLVTRNEYLEKKFEKMKILCNT